MASAVLQLAGAHLANMFVLAALACIAITIFGWAKETMAATSGFRTVSGLTGVLLLFFVYGIYLPRAAHSPDAEASQPAESRTAQTQQVAATRQAAHVSPTSTPPSRQQLLPSAPQPSEPHATPAAQQQSLQPASQASAESLLSGRWKNADPKTASVLLLRVEARGGEITVRAWGMCPPQQANRGPARNVPEYCDWGTGHGVVHDGAATVSWQEGTVLRRMKLMPDGGSLRVVLDSSSRGRPVQHTEAHLAKSL